MQLAGAYMCVASKNARNILRFTRTLNDFYVFYNPCYSRLFMDFF